ncbi:MAG: tRNA pseudouridine(38-40) synthase TruA [Candidatus Heimdallarchaeota archaeon]|nr:tRNA pseudouridine(38-40) synthase TruA [Candidatus Heimdallarchaeota archaeon]
MPQFALKIGYIPSSAYTGFSHQLHDPTNIFTLVVKALEKARLIHTKEEVSFASRTDRGVGALSQVISFHSSIVPILPEINSFLPLDIRVLAMATVPDDFHPRHEAIQRTYSYLLVINENFDFKKAMKVVDIFSGTHDFQNFAKIDRDNKNHTVKTIISISLSRINEYVVRINIISQSFLWQQVRRMIGHIINVATTDLPIESTQLLLVDHSIEQKPPTAPAEPLILEEILYENTQFEFSRKSVDFFRHHLIKEVTKYEAKLALHKYMLDYLIFEKQK